MSDLEMLLLVVVGIYLVECCLWIPRGSVVVQRFPWNQTHICYPSQQLGNRLGGIVFLNPFPPFGRSHLCSQPAIALSPTGVFAYVAQTIDPHSRPDFSEHYFRLDDIKHVTAESRTLLVNGSRFADVGSSNLAEHLPKLVRILVAMSEPERANRIDKEIRTSLDTNKIMERTTQYSEAAGSLRRWCYVLFGVTFAGFPVTVLSRQLSNSWPWLFFPIGLCLVMIARLFHIAHAALYPENRAERWKRILIMFLAPPTAIRLYDNLTLTLLTCFHPLAVVRVTGSDQIFRAFARQLLLDARNPILPVCPTSKAGARETESWFRSRLAALLSDLVTKSGFDLEELLKPPDREGPDCRSYCPRCNQIYAIAQGVCNSCNGIPLVSFD